VTQIPTEVVSWGETESVMGRSFHQGNGLGCGLDNGHPWAQLLSFNYTHLCSFSLVVLLGMEPRAPNILSSHFRMRWGATAPHFHFIFWCFNGDRTQTVKYINIVLTQLKWIFFVCVVLGFELRTYTLSHSTSSFLWFFFQDRVSWTICPGWLRTMILLISAT
jgi:hypothetical protein